MLKYIRALKVHNMIFQNCMCILFEGLSLQRYRSNISVESVKPFGFTKQFCILQLPIFCCVSLIMVTITSHIFINIVQTEQNSVVKFTMDYEKNMSYHAISKSPEVFFKSWKNWTGSFNNRSFSRTSSQYLQSDVLVTNRPLHEWVS